MRSGSAVALSLAVAVVLGSCTADADDPSVDTPGGTASQEPAPSGSSAAATDDTADSVTREAQFDGATIEVSVHPVEVRDGSALLRIDYAPVQGQLPALGLVLAGAEGVGATGAVGLRLVDVEAQEVLPVLVGDGGKRLASGPNDLGAGAEPRTSVSLHAAPEGDSVDVMVPLLGYFPDVPVVEAGDDFDSAASALGTPTDETRYPLRAYRQGLDDSTAVESEGEQVTVKLRSDVLFGSSKFALTGKAERVVDRAAKEIAASSDGGKVQVVGHTDDVDSDSFNQTLSQKRAQAVSTRLAATLGDAYTLIPEGRGEKEPVAAGSSADARAANRRVEITFVGSTDAPTEPEEAELPEATGEVAAAGDTVEVSRYEGDTDRYSLAVQSVVRHDDVLVGTLDLGLVKGSGDMIGVLGEPDVRGAIARGFSNSSSYSAPLDVALLDGDGWTYPLDYATPSSTPDDSRRRLLADEAVNQGAKTPGSTVQVSLVWPDTGSDQVTIDLPGIARFVDVPVTTGEGTD